MPVFLLWGKPENGSFKSSSSWLSGGTAVLKLKQYPPGFSVKTNSGGTSGPWRRASFIDAEKDDSGFRGLIARNDCFTERM